MAIVVQPRKERRSNGGTTGISGGGGGGGRVNTTMTVTSTLSDAQHIALVGHIGFPVTLEIPNVISLPPAPVTHGSNGSNNSNNSNGSNGSDGSSDQAVTKANNVFHIPVVNHSRYTVVMYLGGLQNSNFHTNPSCSGEHRRQHQVALAPLSVSLIELHHRPSTYGLSMLRTTLAIELSYPFQWTQRLPERTWKSYAVDNGTTAKELALINQWMHGHVVLRPPMRHSLPMPVDATNDLYWIATVEGFLRGRYVLKFISSNNDVSVFPHKQLCRQHGFDLDDFRIHTHNNTAPLIVGLATVTAVLGAGGPATVYDVQMVDDHIVVEHLKQTRLSKVVGNDGSSNDGSSNDGSSASKIQVGDQVHVVLPLGIQVMAIPRFYHPGILMKLNSTTNTCNVKLKQHTTTTTTTTTSGGGSSNTHMLRDLPVEWLWLGEKDILPEVGATVHAHHHPPNNIPNITVPWLMNTYRSEAAAANRTGTTTGTTTTGTTTTTVTSHSKLKMLFLNQDSQKLKRHELTYYHDDKTTVQTIQVRNDGFEDVEVCFVTSTGYKWAKEDATEDETEANKTSTESSLATSFVIKRGNFVKLKITWLRSSASPMDKGWLCVCNAKDPTDRSMLSIVGTCNALPLVQVGLPANQDTTTTTTTVAAAAAALVLEVPKTRANQTSTGHLMVRNRTAKAVQLNAVLEPSDAPFLFHNQHGSHGSQHGSQHGSSTRQQLMLGPYEYVVVPVQFQPKQRGRYTVPLTLLSSTVPGDPSEKEGTPNVCRYFTQFNMLMSLLFVPVFPCSPVPLFPCSSPGHHDLDIVGLCSVPLLEGLPMTTAVRDDDDACWLQQTCTTWLALTCITCTTCIACITFTTNRLSFFFLFMC